MPRSSRSRASHKPQRSNSRRPIGPVIEVRSKTELERHLAGADPVMIDFWAPWCGPCKAMAPIFDEVARQYHDQRQAEGSGAEGEQRTVRFLKVNTEAAPEIAELFGIRSIPTLAVLLGGEVIDSNIGLTSASGLQKMARRALDRVEGRTLGQRIKRLFVAA